jgi:hypothetical protein
MIHFSGIVRLDAVTSVAAPFEGGWRAVGAPYMCRARECDEVALHDDV